MLRKNAWNLLTKKLEYLLIYDQLLVLQHKDFSVPLEKNMNLILLGNVYVGFQ